MATCRQITCSWSGGCGFWIPWFEVPRGHPGTLNDELGGPFVPPFLCSWCCSVLFAFSFCHSASHLALLPVTFGQGKVLKSTGFHQGNGQDQAAIDRFVPSAAGDRWRAPNLGSGLPDLRAPVWTPWSSSPAIGGSDSSAVELRFGLFGRRAPSPSAMATRLCPILPLTM